MATAALLLRRHARLATVVFVVVFAGAATVAMSLPDVYSARATVLVEHPGTTEGPGKSLIAGELETRLQTIGQEVVRQASAARLTRLNQELVQMQEVYTPQYPDVIRLKSEIVALERSPKVTAAVGEEFRILDPAVPARTAVAPQRLLFMLFGGGLG